MKTRKRDPKKSLDDAIVGGQAEGQEKKEEGGQRVHQKKKVFSIWSFLSSKR